MAHATIRDVAREADVSVASVSRALNGHARVRPEMRARVQEAASRLGYVPHAGARHLSMARSHTLGVVVPDLHGEFFSELLRGMDREAAALGFNLLLTVLHDDAASEGGSRGLDTLNTMRGRVDGMVLMAPHIAPARLEPHLPRGLPLLFLGCGAPRPADAALRIDNAVGAAAMIDHLVAGGSRRIAHVTGPAGNVDAGERRDGALAAATRAGVPLDIVEGDFSEASGAAAADRIMRDGAPVDAIFAANDMMAIGVLMALKRHGIAVPGQVAVAGFDDVPLARLITPALTTVSIEIAALGARAVQRLVARIDDDTEPATEAFMPRLVVRETTKATPRTGHNRGMET